jgi:hypothetical protein
VVDDMVDDDVRFLLEEVARTPRGRQFVLAGGTALALQLGHRRSNDLDYFRTVPRIDRSSVERTFARLAPAVGTAEVTVAEPGQIDLVVGRRRRKVSFFASPFPVGRHSVSVAGQRCAGPLDVAAMKAYAVGRRAVARDFVDIEAAMSLAGVGLDEIIAEAKTCFRLDGELVFSERLFLQQIADTNDVEDSAGLAMTRSSWPDVAASLRAAVGREVRGRVR